MTSNSSKLLLLLWKNWKLVIRQYKSTIFEILIPLLFIFLIILLRYQEPEEITKITEFKKFKIDDNIITSSTLNTIAYSPKNNYLNEIMDNMEKKLKIKSMAFETSSLMDTFFKDTLHKTIICGIQFDDSLRNIKNLPSKLDIKIRFPPQLRFDKGDSTWLTSNLFLPSTNNGPRNPQDNDGGYPPGYNKEKFASIQHYLSYEIIQKFQETVGDKEKLPDITLQRFPYPPYINDPTILLISRLNLYIVICYLFTAINIVKNITTEKERQLKEFMHIMGLGNWLHWTAWFIKSLCFMLIVTIGIVLCLKISVTKYPILIYSSGTLLFFFMFVYIITSIIFCFMISVFISQASVAPLVTSISWILSIFPSIIMIKSYPQASLFCKLVICLFSNSALGYGIKIIEASEAAGQGIQWGMLWQKVIPNDNLVFGHVIIMLSIDALIYLLITLYVERIFPGKYGVSLPWNFLCKSSYWRVGKNNNMEPDLTQSSVLKNQKTYEAGPDNIPIGVRIIHLSKHFKNTIAVKDLNLNLYEGEITVLIGHNGAGKTTLIFTLTGMYSPTSGTAIIAGHDIRKNIAGVRSSLGLCPQDSIIFEDLTVRENIYFFSKLKGLKGTTLESDIVKYIQLLQLETKEKVASKKLSGGMKRRLSVCIALCGNSKIVILDEPSSGLDPVARRNLWKVLQEEKKTRTLLLSTHFMDEADTLGDRIAIMAEGVLQCCGSSFFLKKLYEVGYYLTINKQRNCDVNKITKFLREYIPNIKVESNIGTELRYLLAEKYVPIFKNLLENLEKNKNSLAFSTYGISRKTLEEVFMKVGSDYNQRNQNVNLQPYETIFNMDDKLLTGYNLYLNMFYAMMIKRIYYLKNAPLCFIVQNLIIIALLIWFLTVLKKINSILDPPALKISLESYDDPIIVISGQNRFKKKYKDIIEKYNAQIIDIGESEIGAYMLFKAKENVLQYRSNYLLGVTFDKDTINAWFNNEALHSIPLALNLIHNSIIKTVTKNNDYNIDITNDPQPRPVVATSPPKDFIDAPVLLFGQFWISYTVVFVLTIITPLYIRFYIQERVIKFKHLQFISGVNPIIFWITAYLWDMTTFIFSSILIIIILAIYQFRGFATFSELGSLFLSLLLFGHAVFPVTYLASFLFKTSASGQRMMTILSILFGIIAHMFLYVLSESLKLAKILNWMFLFAPHYGMITIIQNLYKVSIEYYFCNLLPNVPKTNKCKKEYFAWDDPGIGKIFLFFFLDGIVAFIILIFCDYGKQKNIFRKLYRKKELPPLPPDEDKDVADERLKVNSLSNDDLNSHNLVLSDLSKYYKEFQAVQRLTLSVKVNECFGLLGVNGAGKTTTFRMLTFDERVSCGDAWMKGIHIETPTNKVFQHMGYCPQFHALLDDLTGRQTLSIFGLIRGVPKYKFFIQELSQKLNFGKYINKKIKTYSGGNKRKLSTAIALIGHPHIIYLDEPTTGIDPASKRSMWNVLNEIRNNGTCIILSSHSMEECEVLCTRLAIMVEGNFKCLGSVQYLKNKFSDYVLIVKIKKQITERQIEAVNTFITNKFPRATLEEKYLQILTYHITARDIILHEAFGIMEEGKKKLLIEDYSLEQNNLEYVFLKFSEGKMDQKKDKRKNPKKT